MATPFRGMSGGLGRWLRQTRQRIPTPISRNVKVVAARPRDRSLLERMPAPRGHDALHDKAWHAGLHWFHEDRAAKQTLAQRAQEVLAGLGPLQLPARQVDDGQPGGLHRSLRRGGGVEFSEHKEYAPGDDLRHLDWKAYARTDRYYIKRYEQEVHASLTLVLDASASMGFSDLRGGDKFDAVRLLLATLGLVLVRQGDAVGLVIVGHPELNLEPAGGMRHFANVCERLENAKAEGQAGLDALGPGSWRGLDRRGIAVVASDALVQPELAVAPLVDLSRAGMDVLLLHTLHPRERDLDFHGPTQLHCQETDARRLVDPRLVKHTYVEMMQAHCDRLRVLATHAGLGYLGVDTAIDPRGVMRQVLRATARLRRRGQAVLGAGAYGEQGFDADALMVEEG
jgi:uncharacterized protein (DUF58 family)